MTYYIFDDGNFFTIAKDEKCKNVFDWCGGEIGGDFSGNYIGYAKEFLNDGTEKTFIFQDGEIIKGDFSDCVIRADEKRKESLKK